ncbi:MAG: response regulator [Gammaproteobacteria bacterium]|nr:response regulator [Gammaproteobacteria bacterium]MCH9744677.1 response regulator [Gammaproteobacteria bacterium]
MPRILLIEQNRMSQLIVKFFFIGLGCQLDIANSGWQALQKLNKTHYDLIMMALKLPDLDGFAVASMIRQGKKHWNQVPIVAITNKASTAQREKTLQAGMNDYYVMPLSEMTCQKMIDKYLIHGDYCTAQG